MLLPIVLLAVTMAAGASLVFQSQAVQQVDSALAREANELKLLSVSYDSASELLRDFIQQSSPDENEQLFAVVDSQVLIRSGTSGIRLDQDQQFLSLVSAVSQTQVGNYESVAGEFRYIAIPVNAEPGGVFVGAFDTASTEQQINNTLASFTLLATLAIAVAITIGWFASGRIFKPIAQMSQSAQAIDSHDLRARLPHGDSSNELDRLAREFNQMLDRLEIAFENQKQFVDDAGHELRTPLTVIRGHLDLLEKNPEENSASLEIVKDELSRMSRLVFDLQTLTKSNQPDFVSVAAVDIGQLNDELFVKAESLADRNWMPAELSQQPVVSIDRQRITQAMLQLADNAAKQTKPEDTIQVGVEIGSDYVAFFVSDSGPGIPVAEREKIVKRFSRGQTHIEKGEGSGLGLAVVEAIAKAHSGYLRIDSSPLGGAWVGIVLPRGES
jgi:signal transduction histidine kinase